MFVGPYVWLHPHVKTEPPYKSSIPWILFLGALRLSCQAYLATINTLVVQMSPFTPGRLWRCGQNCVRVARIIIIVTVVILLLRRSLTGLATLESFHLSFHKFGIKLKQGSSEGTNKNSIKKQDSTRYHVGTMANPVGSFEYMDLIP